jgi:hypothetical protein
MQRVGGKITSGLWPLGDTARSRLSCRLMLGGLVSVGLWLSPDGAWAGGSEGHDSTLIASIGISILAATVLAFLSHAAKQPLLLAYIAAGVLIGPQMGLGLVTSEADIRTISEIGLIILLFMIGLEIDVTKLKEAGKSLILSGIGQFLLCTALGVGFFRWLGYGLGRLNRCQKFPRYLALRYALRFCQAMEVADNTLCSGMVTSSSTSEHAPCNNS